CDASDQQRGRDRQVHERRHRQLRSLHTLTIVLCEHPPQTGPQRARWNAVTAFCVVVDCSNDVTKAWWLYALGGGSCLECNVRLNASPTKKALRFLESVRDPVIGLQVLPSCDLNNQISIIAMIVSEDVQIAKRVYGGMCSERAAIWRKRTPQLRRIIQHVDLGCAGKSFRR